VNIIKFFKRILPPLNIIYELKNTHNLLEELAIFLYFEVSRGGSDWIRLINTLKKDGDEISGNLMTIEKRGSDLYIGNIHYKGPEDEQEYFVISKHELKKLMQQWEKLMEEKPDEIILSEENGEFELIGKNYFTTITHKEIES
jgi:hypothetical protein